MAISKRGSRKIIIDNIEFRWSATGNDGWITIVIWTEVNNHFKLIGSFGYHSEFEKQPDKNGCYKITKGQIIITNRVIRRIIEYVTVDTFLNSYGQTNLDHLEDIYEINNALRVSMNTDYK